VRSGLRATQVGEILVFGIIAKGMLKP